jgi:GNAT superfamily N-acetyltransferase
MSDRWRIRQLRDGDSRQQFCCGVESLDRYFSQQASQDARRGYSSPFVAENIATCRIDGFYTLSMAGVDVSLVPEYISRKLPRYPCVPAVRMGRLAVAANARGLGLGAILLADALRRPLSGDIAWAAFIVDAKNDDARNFYLKYGFISLRDDPNHLFLTRTDIEGIFAGA